MRKALFLVLVVVASAFAQDNGVRPSEDWKKKYGTYLVKRQRVVEIKRRFGIDTMEADLVKLADELNKGIVDECKGKQCSIYDPALDMFVAPAESNKK